MNAPSDSRRRTPGAAKPGRPPGNPDAELIRICAQHIVNLRAYNTSGSHLEAERDPLWRAYESTRDAITEAEPQTLGGMLAKARAAKAEAKMLDGSEMPEGCPAATWAWDLVSDLLRLHGGGQSPRQKRRVGSAPGTPRTRSVVAEEGGGVPAATPKAGGQPMGAELIAFPLPATKDELVREMKTIQLAGASGRLSEEEHQAQLFQFFIRFAGALAAQQRGIAAPSAYRTDRL